MPMGIPRANRIKRFGSACLSDSVYKEKDNRTYHCISSGAVINEIRLLRSVFG